MHRFLISLIYFSLWVVPISAVGQREVPALAGHRIHDEAGILSPSTVSSLELSLQRFEDSTSNQIGVLIFNSLEGESIDQYGIRVAGKWKLGKQDRDNGVILLVAVADRKVRIEVGQGLEGPLPDAICNRIIRNEMAPSFRRGDYDAGITASIDAIGKAIRGEYKGSGPTARKKRTGSPSWFVILLLIIILVMRNRGGSGGRGNGWSSGAGWFLAGALGGSMRGGGGGGGGSWGGGGGGFGGGGSSGSW